MMPRSLHSLFLALLLLAALLPSAGAAPLAASAQDSGPSLWQADAHSLVFDLAVPALEIDNLVVEGRAFQRLSLPGYAAVGEPGQPELLQTGVVVGIPSTGSVTVRVLHSAVEDLPGAYTVYPMPLHEIRYDPASGQPDPMAGVVESFTQDAAAYAREGFLPGEVVTLGEIGFMRQQRIARLEIRPVQYDAARGALRLTRSLRIEVSFPGAELVPAAAADLAATDAFEPLLASQLLNYQQAKAWRLPRRTAEQPAGPGQTPRPGDDTQPWFKVKLRQSGLYRVAAADLDSTGIVSSAAVDPARLQVWKDGQQQPADFLGDSDASFEAGEALVFYAEAPFSPYTRDTVYWLTVGSAPGLRMALVDGAPAGQAPEANVPATIRLEQDYLYAPDVPKSDEPNQPPRWYWDEMNLDDPTTTIEVALPHAITSGYNATLTVRLVGITYPSSVNPDHRVTVDINGQAVGTIDWDGRVSTMRQIEFPASALVVGQNSIRFHLPGTTGADPERAYLDWLELSYRRDLAQSGDLFAFDAQGAGRREFEVSGFHSAAVLTYDVSIPSAPRRVTGVQVQPMAGAQPSAGQIRAASSASPLNLAHRLFLPLAGIDTAPGAYAARFAATLAGDHRFVLAGPESIYPVARIVGDTASSLRSPANQADYLLITHGSFKLAAQTLSNHRQSAGLGVALIDVQDIYDEFSDGQVDPQAIRDFVDYAYHNWQDPAPAYVLLLGDGHYDYRMNNGRATFAGFIPPYIACYDPWLCEVASDNAFVAVAGSDRLPDLALGRLPAASAESANRMVAKTIAYESSAPAGPWRSTITCIADNAYSASGQRDRAGDFEQLCNGVNELFPANYTRDRVYYDPYPNDDQGETYRRRTPEATTQAITDSVNAGRLFVNYIGHAAINAWAHELILVGEGSRRDDVRLMVNATMLPVFLDMACLSGNFADVDRRSMEEVLLNRQGGGSVGGWGATGFGVATGHDALHHGFYSAIFDDGVTVLGLAAVAGKQDLWRNGRSLDLLDTFGLLSDPALRLSLP